jgi:hypothetical protein
MSAKITSRPKDHQCYIGCNIALGSIRPTNLWILDASGKKDKSPLGYFGKPWSELNTYFEPIFWVFYIKKVSFTCSPHKRREKWFREWKWKRNAWVKNDAQTCRFFPSVFVALFIKHRKQLHFKSRINTWSDF